jgi:uncharacterized protein (TIGR03435 family)
MKRAIVTALLATIATAVRGQSPAPPAFEAVSIKLASRDKVGGGLNLFPARIRIVNASLKFCVQHAWNVMDYQVVGATGWMDTDRYEIDAVAASPFNGSEYRAMLQTLLAGRFGLVSHHETQDKAGYVLLAGRRGPKLPAPKEDSDIVFGRTLSGEVTLKATDASLSQLAGALSSTLGATVIDQTGIEGPFDVSLQYTPDQPLLTKSGLPITQPPDALPGRSIFSALQEKLGLKLEARKVPIDTIVIDHANRPSDN